MAARRVRIRGIANIPVRRKTEVTSEKQDETPKDTEEIPSDHTYISSDIKSTNKNNLTPNQNLDFTKNLNGTSNKLQNNEEIIKEISNTPIKHKTEETSEKIKEAYKENCQDVGTTEHTEKILIDHNYVASTIKSTSENNFKEIQNTDVTTKLIGTSDKRQLILQTNEVSNNNNNEQQNIANVIENESSHESQLNQTENSTQLNSKLSRRWSAKPSVRIPAITRKVKVTDSEEVISSEPTSVIPDVDVETSASVDNISICENKTPDNNVIGAVSPSKHLNRARIRPVPRFIRRSSIHGSASESEDDNRKALNRTRNDSICSLPATDGQTIPMEEPLSKPIKLMSHRKIRYTDQSRKLATARREFQLKFGSLKSCPDRKRLTMMDLIFYNPSSNPMPEKPSRKNSVDIIAAKVEEEQEDDPNEAGDMEVEGPPVPQVKVGPDGEIILDEQSLVIEQTGAKRAREQMQNSQVVIDDLDTGYGVYKRPKRCREWSVAETLRFYRALNTVGTDFSLMLGLFPGRSRRDLKMKFKKEERNNRPLVDKVLMNPLHFDMARLEEQLQTDQTDAIFSNKKAILDNTTLKKKKNYYNTSLLSREIDDENESISKKKKNLSKIKMQNQKNESYCALQKGLDSLIDSSESENDMVVIPDVNIVTYRPTRTCRLKKPNNYEMLLTSDESDSEERTSSLICPPVKKYPPNILKTSQTENNFAADNEVETDLNDNDTIMVEEEVQPTVETNIVIAHSENEKPEKILIDILSKTDMPMGETKMRAKDEADLPSMEPGSLMILSRAGPAGEKQYQVYMVTPDQGNVPIDLSEDVVRSLTSKLGVAEEMPT